MLLNHYHTLLWWPVLDIFCQCQFKQTERTLEFLQFVWLLGSLGLQPDHKWAYPRKCTSNRWNAFLWLDEKDLKWASMGDACTHYSESSIPQLHPGIQVPVEYCRISLFIFYCTCKAQLGASQALRSPKYLQRNAWRLHASHSCGTIDQHKVINFPSRVHF